MDINIIIPADREAVILFDCVGQEYSYKFKPTTTFYSSLTKEAKQQKIDESTLLKVTNILLQMLLILLSPLNRLKRQRSL